MRDRGQGRRLALLGLALLMAITGLLAGQVPARADDPVKVLLLLDVSGSMNEKITGGTKLAAAKKALKQVADSLPAGTQVGLRVYGSKIKEPKEENPKACQDTELVMPVGPLDRNRMYAAVDSFDAVGETPISYALEQSVNDLGSEGRRVVVLISDGEENCVPDPCPVAKKLAGAGVDLQFNAIGFDVNAKARKQLQCIVDLTDGSYYDADDTEELVESLDKLTKRALRPFSISGKPVKGTADRGSAPTISAGQYVDRHDASGKGRYYWIERAPGSTVSVGATTITIPHRQAPTDGWHLVLRAEGGELCSQDHLSGTAWDGSVEASAAAVTTAGAIEPCATGRLLLEVARSPSEGDRDDARVELAIHQEPPIANLPDLPPALTALDPDRPAVPAAKRAEKVVGGVAFSDAPVLRPGSYVSEMAVGETLAYRVEVQPGQRLRATLEAPRTGTKWNLDSNAALTPGLMVYSPSRDGIDEQSGSITRGTPVTIAKTTAMTPEIRIRNRENDTAIGPETAIARASMGGTYYLLVQLRPSFSDLIGTLMPIQLNVAVDGEPAGLPVYGTPTPTPTTSPSATTPTTSSSAPTSSDSSASSSPSTPGQQGDESPGIGGAVAVVVGILGGLLVAGAVIVLVLRRRGRG